jgi:polyphosphate kinase
MTKSEVTPVEIDLEDSRYYVNRELSWLEFNRRVLHEAFDPRTPFLERLKFLAIFSSNLDEFFMVRVSTIKEQAASRVSVLPPDGLTPQQQLDEINKRLRPMVVEQHRYFEQEMRALMAEKGIHLLNYIDLNQEQRFYLQHYFEKQVFPVLTPLAVDPGHPFPRMSNLSLNLAVTVKDANTGQERFARVKVPNILPRFVAFPKEMQQVEGKPCAWMGVPLEQVIAHNLEALFPGMNILEYNLFRITRDADFPVQEEEADDLLLAIEQEISKRRLGGSTVRMEIQNTIPDSVRQILMEELELGDEDVYALDGLLNLKDLFYFMGLPLPDLKDPPFSAAIPPAFKLAAEFHPETGQARTDETEDIFSVIRQRDVLVHHPYESFAASVQLFINQAAYDPSVLAIKMTLYRTSGDSPIVKTLIAAAENGKEVVTLVELKARFDEENNINWARRLEDSGVHVVYGLVGLKTHTKTTLIVRKEGDRIRRYVHIGTGNYNPKTAGLYTDLGLFSCREDLGADLTDLFNFLTGYSRQHSYRKLLVAPVNMRDRMLALIQRETDHAKAGHSGRIIAKMNSLVDPQIVKSLYAASQAGVQIDLIVRGICCLRPGIKGLSDSIRVVSIVGRFLEHSRIFYFHNNGQEEIYIGSADWMPRNLDRRVEAIVPVEDPALFKDLQEILAVMMADNRQAWDLQPDGSYIQRQPTEANLEQSAHKEFMAAANQSSQISLNGL